MTRFEAEANRRLGVPSDTFGEASLSALSQKLERLDLLETRVAEIDAKMPSTVPTGSAELAAVVDMAVINAAEAQAMSEFFATYCETLNTAIVRDNAKIPADRIARFRRWAALLAESART